MYLRGCGHCGRDGHQWRTCRKLTELSAAKRNAREAQLEQRGGVVAGRRRAGRASPYMAPAAAVAAADAPPVQAPAADPPQAAPDEDLEGKCFTSRMRVSGRDRSCCETGDSVAVPELRSYPLIRWPPGHQGFRYAPPGEQKGAPWTAGDPVTGRTCRYINDVTPPARVIKPPVVLVGIKTWVPLWRRVTKPPVVLAGIKTWVPLWRRVTKPPVVLAGI